MKFIDSKENSTLKTEFTEQAIRQEKLRLLSETEQLYNTPPAYPCGWLFDQYERGIAKLTKE